MKDIYYADNRDLVKWAGIVRLCQSTGIRNVMQVAYYRSRTEKESERQTLNFNGEKCQISDFVLAHFRNLDDIKRIGSVLKIAIELHKDEFQARKRQSFHQEVANRIQLMGNPAIILLDPDIGLGSSKRRTSRHVTSEDVRCVYESLRPDDVMVLYQHRLRRPDWLSHCRSAFAQACGKKDNRVREWGSDLAKDVAFFYTTR